MEVNEKVLIGSKKIRDGLKYNDPAFIVCVRGIMDKETEAILNLRGDLGYDSEGNELSARAVKKRQAMEKIREAQMDGKEKRRSRRAFT
jgi:hypothetical protein